VPQDPFPPPGPGAEEPGSSRLPPAAAGEWEDWDGPGEQGLYVCLPAGPAALKTPLIPVTRGPCDHARAETGYHPSRKLQHLIRARSAACTAPGCRRTAARCDLDHTVPWDQGGLTCECGLAPLRRQDHRCKQAEGWRLTQPEPGLMVWRTPSGRSYATTPTEYAT
jgi:hypothetical protein